METTNEQAARDAVNELRETGAMQTKVDASLAAAFVTAGRALDRIDIDGADGREVAAVLREFKALYEKVQAVASRGEDDDTKDYLLGIQVTRQR